eukprot:31226-Pelagococcus_subviridis.AAC.7
MKRRMKTRRARRKIFAASYKRKDTTYSTVRDDTVASSMTKCQNENERLRHYACDTLFPGDSSAPPTEPRAPLPPSNAAYALASFSRSDAGTLARAPSSAFATSFPVTRTSSALASSAPSPPSSDTFAIARCTACMDASDTSARKSAPVNPSVLAATSSHTIDNASDTFPTPPFSDTLLSPTPPPPPPVSVTARSLATAARIARRSSRSGNGTRTSRSNRPGRSNAGSTRSGRDVAPITVTPTSASTPSSSVNSWFTTLSVTPVLSCPRLGAIASNSSKKSAHGAAAAARRNVARTPASLWPMYLFRSSGPFTTTTRRPADAIAARARSVFPHPGGPYSKTPVRKRSGAAPNTRACRVGNDSASSSAAFARANPPTRDNAPSAPSVSGSASFPPPAPALAPPPSARIGAGTRPTRASAKSASARRPAVRPSTRLPVSSTVTAATETRRARASPSSAIATPPIARAAAACAALSTNIFRSPVANPSAAAAAAAAASDRATGVPRAAAADVRKRSRPRAASGARSSNARSSLPAATRPR